VRRLDAHRERRPAAAALGTRRADLTLLAQRFLRLQVVALDQQVAAVWRAAFAQLGRPCPVRAQHARGHLLSDAEGGLGLRQVLMARWIMFIHLSGVGPPQADASQASALLHDHHAMHPIAQRGEAGFAPFPAVLPPIGPTRQPVPIQPHRLGR
jgi:hypothetical protein